MLTRRDLFKFGAILAVPVFPTAFAADNKDAKTSATPVYAIGDVHGTIEPLKALVNKLPPDAKLIFLGDLADKGPHTIEVLKYVKGLGDRAVTILGNRDLRVLQVAADGKPLPPNDPLAALMASPEKEELIDWLRNQKVAHFENGTLFVHAGVHADWSVEDTMRYAKELEDALHSNNWKEVVLNLKTKDPDWSPDLTGYPRLRSISNVILNQRFVRKSDGQPDYVSHDAPSKAPEGQIAWFDYPNRVTANNPIVFGHWIKCGLLIRPNLQCLDSGSWKGGTLTAGRYPKLLITQVDSKKE